MKRIVGVLLCGVLIFALPFAGSSQSATLPGSDFQYPPVDPSLMLSLTPSPAATNPPDGAAFEFADNQYVVTSGWYLPENALAGAQNEFGALAQLADWNDISSLYSGNISAFMDSAGIQADVDIWILREGQGYDGQRHYFLARISAPRSNFKRYATIDDKAWLGSWYGIEMPVLVKLPLGETDSTDEETDSNDEETDSNAHPPEEITGRFRYYNNYEADFYYDDNYFAQASTVYSDSLSTMSLCLAMSAFAKSVNDEGESQPYQYRSENVQALLSQTGFSSLDTNHWFTVVPTTDSIGVAAGAKQVDYDGGTYTLLAVAIRGGGYESEWASNFTIGLNGEHNGFSNAKTQVLNFIKNYITEHQITGDVKLWITGYSRAGGTANIVAAAIDRGEVLSPNINLLRQNVFAYCFEPPAGAYGSVGASMLAGIFQNELYDNIFNIVNPADPVSKLAPFVLGFGRYGQDIMLPSKTFGSQYETKKNAMLRFYYSLESIDDNRIPYTVDDFCLVSFLPEIHLPAIDESVENTLGGMWDTLAGLGSDAADLLTGGGELIGDLWDSYAGPLSGLYDEAAEDVALVNDWISDGVSALSDFAASYTGGNVFDALHNIYGAAYDTALFAGEKAIDGAKEALEKANDLAQAAAGSANAFVNYIKITVADAVNQDIFLDILISKIALLNIQSRTHYAAAWQTPIRESVRMLNDNFTDEKMDAFIEKLETKTLSKAFQIFSIISEPGDINMTTLRNLISPIVTESLRESGITQYNAPEAAALTILFVDQIITLIKDNPMLLLSAYNNADGLKNAHMQEVCFAWLMSRDSNYTMPDDTSLGSWDTDADTAVDLTAPQYNVSFYTDTNQNGSCIVRRPGQYALSETEMGFPNDTLSCILIGQRPDGNIRVTVYENHFYNMDDPGSKLTFEQPGVYNLTNYNFNDKCSSYQITLVPSE